MTKEELITEIRNSTPIMVKQANDAVNAILDSIKEAIGKGEEVSLKGFGAFYIINRAARTGRNLKTGESIHIAASKSVKFRPSKILKESLQV